MSEQYQRFKQNFFRQHPPSTSDSNAIHQTASKSFKHYDPHNQYTPDPNNTYRREESLRIQNQVHFPFEEIEQTTFQDFDNYNFLPFKQQQNFSNGLEKSTAHKHYVTNSNHSVTQNQSYPQEYRNNRNHIQVRQVPIKTESHLEYRTLSKHQFQNSRQNHQFQQKRIPLQNSFTHQSYEINKNYVVQPNRSNNFLPASPSKQLPVIYNRPNSLSNSNHKLNPAPVSSSNSRIILQQITQPNQVQGSLFLTPSPNQLHQTSINQAQRPQTFNQMPQIPQGISSGSRVVQSEMVGQSKALIQSSHNILPPPQTIISSRPPQQLHLENRIIQQTMVPFKEYEKLKEESLMWQQKFYQVNDQLTRLQSEKGGIQYGHGFSQQTISLREENVRLVQKIRSLQNSNNNLSQKIKQSFEELVKKYQSSLMKEADLLVDRFRLQMKHNQRY